MAVSTRAVRKPAGNGLPARQSPGAAAKRPRPIASGSGCVVLGDRLPTKLSGGRFEKRQVGTSGRKTSQAPAGRSKTAKGQNPMSAAGSKVPAKLCIVRLGSGTPPPRIIAGA